MTRKKKAQIISVIIVLALVIATFVIKHQMKEKEEADTSATATNTTQEKENSGDQKAEPITSGKFALEEKEAIDYDKLFKDKIPVVVDYGSEGCGPCRAFMPLMIKLNKDFEGKAYVKYVDIWEHQGAQGDVPVRVIPTQVFFDANGKPYQPTDDEAKALGLIVYKDDDGNPKYTLHEGPMEYDDLVSIVNKMGAAK